MGEQEFDVIVIGSGPGGYVAAIRAAQLGLKTACVEKDATFGGTCLNVGCIPSKALLQSSEHYAFLNHGANEHGIDVEKAAFDLGKMMTRKTSVVKSLTDGVAGLLKRNKIETFQGTATFLSPHEIDVGGKTVRGKYFILATGSEPIELPFLKFDEKTILSSTGALSLQKVPDKLLVIGAGVIGVELASVYSRLGSEVTIIEMLEQICVPMDLSVSKMLQKILQKQGLSFYLGAKVEEAEASKEEITLKVATKEGKEEFTGNAVLVAIGRRPFTKGLGLDKIGVKTTDRGFVAVDSSLRTNQPHIYAIGDIVEGPMLAHRASEEGVVVAELIAGMKPHINYIAIPNVIYTHPEVSSLGLSEEEAKKMGLEIFTGTCMFKGNARARCAGDTDGMVKVIGEKNSGRLIGMHIIGPSASEMIGEGVLAIEKGATVEEVAYASHAHPTLTEAIKEAALASLGKAIHI